jgi:hypothetical protein
VIDENKVRPGSELMNSNLCAPAVSAVNERQRFPRFHGSQSRGTPYFNSLLVAISEPVLLF